MSFVSRVTPAFTSQPSNPKAAKHYSDAIASLRLMDALAARNSLHKAVAADPSDPLIHAALAESLSILGYLQNARKEAKIAYEQGSRLPREEFLLIEGLYRELSNDWDRAIQIYKSLIVFYPGNLECMLRLATVLIRSGKAAEGLEILETLKKSHENQEDPRVDLAEAVAADALSDFSRKIAAASRAAVKAAIADSRASRLLTARARMMEASGYTDLGDPKRAEVILEEARQIFNSEGDQSGEARVILNLGNVYRRKGDAQSAKKLFEESLAIFRKIGDRGGESSALNLIANTDRLQGHLAVARTLYESAFEASKNAGDRAAMVQALIGIANVLLQEGDLEGAKKRFNESLDISHKIGYRIGIARTMNNLAEIYHYQGRLHEAQTFFEEVLEMKQEMGDRSSLAFTLYDLAELLLAQGHHIESRSRYEESFTIRHEIGERGTAAESKLGIGLVLLEDCQFPVAEQIARETAELFRSEMRTDDEGFALCLLARALHGQERYGEALQAAEHAVALASRNKGLRMHLLVSLHAARIYADAGLSAQASEALTRLQNILDEARKKGFADVQFEARLAMGEIELQSMKLPAGKTHLAALEREARAKGFGLVAGKAARILARNKDQFK
jgi:tetratricopeptide (TPR) repeat protein